MRSKRRDVSKRPCMAGLYSRAGTPSFDDFPGEVFSDGLG